MAALLPATTKQKAIMERATIEFSSLEDLQQNYEKFGFKENSLVLIRNINSIEYRKLERVNKEKGIRVTIDDKDLYWNPMPIVASSLQSNSKQIVTSEKELALLSEYKEGDTVLCLGKEIQGDGGHTLRVLSSKSGTNAIKNKNGMYWNEVDNSNMSKMIEVFRQQLNDEIEDNFSDNKNKAASSFIVNTLKGAVDGLVNRVTELIGKEDTFNDKISTKIDKSSIMNNQCESVDTVPSSNLVNTMSKDISQIKNDMGDVIRSSDVVSAYSSSKNKIPSVYLLDSLRTSVGLNDQAIKDMGKKFLDIIVQDKNNSEIDKVPSAKIFSDLVKVVDIMQTAIGGGASESKNIIELVKNKLDVSDISKDFNTTDGTKVASILLVQELKKSLDGIIRQINSQISDISKIKNTLSSVDVNAVSAKLEAQVKLINDLKSTMETYSSEIMNFDSRINENTNKVATALKTSKDNTDRLSYSVTVSDVAQDINGDQLIPSLSIVKIMNTKLAELQNNIKNVKLPDNILTADKIKNDFSSSSKTDICSMYLTSSLLTSLSALNTDMSKLKTDLSNKVASCERNVQTTTTNMSKVENTVNAVNSSIVNLKNTIAKIEKEIVNIKPSGPDTDIQNQINTVDSNLKQAIRQLNTSLSEFYSEFKLDTGLLLHANGGYGSFDVSDPNTSISYIQDKNTVLMGSMLFDKNDGALYVSYRGADINGKNVKSAFVRGTLGYALNVAFTAYSSDIVVPNTRVISSNSDNVTNTDVYRTRILRHIIEDAASYKNDLKIDLTYVSSEIMYGSNTGPDIHSHPIYVSVIDNTVKVYAPNGFPSSKVSIMIKGYYKPHTNLGDLPKEVVWSCHDSYSFRDFLR